MKLSRATAERYEDNDFNFRVERSGVRCVWANDVVVEHQWHDGWPDPNGIEHEKFNISYGSQQVHDIVSGKRTLESNIGKNWGDENS